MHLPRSPWWSVHSETYRQALGHWKKGSMGRRAACGSTMGLAKGAVLPVTCGFPIARGAQALWLLARPCVSPAWGKKLHPRVAVTIFSFQRKISSQPESLNSPVSGSELNRPFLAVVSSAPAADCLLFYPVLPLCLCVQQLCKVAIKELN